jgi:putative flippase GtrA
MRGGVPAPATAAPAHPYLALIRQLFAFGVVGVLGFLVDAGTLYLARWLGLGLFLGRVISYSTAATSTWALNRRYTFTSGQNRGPFREWLLFMISQLAGAAFNLGLYGWLVTNSARVAAQPVIGVAAGSLAGMLVNFFVAKKFVFKER